MHIAPIRTDMGIVIRVVISNLKKVVVLLARILVLNICLKEELKEVLSNFMDVKPKSTKMVSQYLWALYIQTEVLKLDS